MIARYVFDAETGELASLCRSNEEGGTIVAYTNMNVTQDRVRCRITVMEGRDARRELYRRLYGAT